MKVIAIKSSTLLVCFLLIVFFCVGIANQIQIDSGNIDVSIERIDARSKGEITGKLYKPITATASNPAPAVLLIHGYQNDKDTGSAYALELARRGYVVLSIDAYGHGSTTVGLKERGYVNHISTANFGEGELKNISGPDRYKIMLNFSNLSFFNDRYSKDNAGNSIRDSSVGGIIAYSILSNYDFVDSTRMGVGGHSMGTWASWSVAAAYSGITNGNGEDITPKAIVLQCGELFTDDVYNTENIQFNNVLLLQAKYDEFAMFRDYRNTVTDDLPQSSLRSGFLGIMPTYAAWNTSYGNMDDGTARQMILLKTNHRLVTHSTEAVTAAVEWYNDALNHMSTLPSTEHLFLVKEYLVFGAMLFALAAMLALMNLLLCIPFFSSISKAVPDRPERAKTGWKWWKGAIITVLIAAFTYPFMSQLGHGLLPLPESVFRMTIGNGFVSWYLLLIIIMLITTLIPWSKAKKKDAPLDYCDLGLATEDKPGKFDWALLGKSAILAFLMAGFVYLLVWISNSLFLLDFRMIWPFFRPFSADRLIQFLVYIPIFALFFILNNSKIFAQMRHPAANCPGFKGFMSSFWRNAICMAGGIFLVCLIEYIPFFMGIGPGADLLFSSTFGGPFMSLLLVFFPQILVLAVLCTFIYRRTGHVFVSGLTAGILSCWIITGGSAML